MHIDSYQFGKIVIDGKLYSSDCLIISNSVSSDWWRKQGHLLSPGDLQAVTAAGPKILVVGCGTPGMMKISKDTEEILRQHDIELFAGDTHQAVAKFNELAAKGENPAAALHLTC